MPALVGPTGHPMLLLSSGRRRRGLRGEGRGVLRDGFVERSGRQASVEDADESAGDWAEGGSLAGPAGADCVVLGAGVG